MQQRLSGKREALQYLKSNNALVSDFYFVVDTTTWTIIKKARKQSTKFLKVGVLYARFDLAKKKTRNNPHVRRYIKYQAKRRTITWEVFATFAVTQDTILLNFALQIT